MKVIKKKNSTHQMYVYNTKGTIKLYFDFINTMKRTFKKEEWKSVAGATEKPKRLWFVCMSG